MKKYILALCSACLLMFSIIACTENPTEPDAVQMNIQEMRVSPGFLWFDTEYNAYNINTAKAGKLDSLFKAGNFSFGLFVKSSCDCPGTHKQFPQAYKILKSAGVPDSLIQIYSVSSTETKHPYQNVFKLNTVPAFVVFRNGVPSYSIVDSLNYYDVYFPSRQISLEELFNMALSK